LTAARAGATVAGFASARSAAAFPHERSVLALTPRQLALRAVELAQSKKAEDIVLVDLRKVTNFAEFFVICTARSDTQVHAVAGAVTDGLAAIKHKVWHSEGFEGRSWVLLDYVDIVVHVFLPETRHYYSLERLWGDAPQESFPD
jgi:ribosome-associated protein